MYVYIHIYIIYIYTYIHNILFMFFKTRLICNTDMALLLLGDFFFGETCQVYAQCAMTLSDPVPQALWIHGSAMDDGMMDGINPWNPMTSIGTIKIGNRSIGLHINRLTKVFFSNFFWFFFSRMTMIFSMLLWHIWSIRFSQWSLNQGTLYLMLFAGDSAWCPRSVTL